MLCFIANSVKHLASQSLIILKTVITDFCIFGQLNHLDKLDTGEMLGLGLISFLPLHPGDDNTLHTKQIHEEIITRIG